MIWKINLSTSTEERKEKEAGSGGWRVKEGSEFTLGCEGSAQRGCEHIWKRGLRQTRRGCSSQREGRVQGPQGDAQGVQDKEAGEWSENEGVRVETEQEEPGGTPVRGGGGQTWFEVLRNHSCALQKTDSKWGRMRVDTSEEATRIIKVRDDSGQDQSGNGEMGSHSRHMLKVESERPADRMGVAVRAEEIVVFGMRKGKDRVSIY